jgi:hypothetical protein
VLQRADGSYVGYNCNVTTQGKTVVVTASEDTISRIHLNLKKDTLIKTTIKGKTIQGTYKKGMQWIGPGGIPEDIVAL